MKFLTWLKYQLSRFFRFVTKPRFAWGVRGLKYTRIGSTTVISYPENLVLGEHVFIAHFSFIDAQVRVEIGEGCQIGYWVTIVNHSSHIAIRLYGKEYANLQGAPSAYLRGPVKIGAYTFIGPHSIIMPGTTIGKGSIVSAHSIVKGEFPDFAIIAGNPARCVGDTRELDEKYLKQYPELRVHYDEWVSRL